LGVAGVGVVVGVGGVGGVGVVGGGGGALPAGQDVSARAGIRWREILLGFAMPVAGLLALVAAVNAFKFGSPLRTGYEQMVEQRDELGGSLTVGLRGSAWSPQASVFTHFPPVPF